MASSTSTRHLGVRDEVVTLLRARTIAAAVELFYENGYQNTTLEMVADRIGMTKPFIYAHFTSKSGLLAEICSRGNAWSIEAIDSVLPLRIPATEKLGLLGERSTKS